MTPVIEQSLPPVVLGRVAPEKEIWPFAELSVPVKSPAQLPVMAVTFALEIVTLLLASHDRPYGRPVKAICGQRKKPAVNARLLISAVSPVPEMVALPDRPQLKERPLLTPILPTFDKRTPEPLGDQVSALAVLAKPVATTAMDNAVSNLFIIVSLFGLSAAAGCCR